MKLTIFKLNHVFMKITRPVTKAFAFSFASLFLVLLSCGGVDAHQRNVSYVYLEIFDDRIEGRVELRNSDLVQIQALGFSSKPTAEEMLARIDDIRAYTEANLIFSSVLGDHNFIWSDNEVLEVKPDLLLVSRFKFTNITTPPEELQVLNTIFLSDIPDHNSELTIFHFWKAGIISNEGLPSHIFSNGDSSFTLSLTDQSITNGVIALIKLGIKHIWIGFDHILFLIALLLPSVSLALQPLTRRQMGVLTYTEYAPVESFKSALFNVIKIVTLFTVAHTITLSLAALDIILLPSKLVETIIAVSIALAAIHIIYPVAIGKEWLIAFIFGLFHGFGFASVLAEKTTGGDYLAYSLFSFNVGVEIGQIGIICIVFPILFLFRRWKHYSAAMTIASVVLIGFSFYWLLERLLETEFLPTEIVGKFLRDVYYGRL